MGLKKFGFRSKRFHYPHKRPAPSSYTHLEFMERFGATVVSFGAVIGNCEKYLGATIRVFI